MSKSRTAVEKLPLYIIEDGETLAFNDERELSKYTRIPQPKISAAMMSNVDPFFIVDGVTVYQVEPDMKQEIETVKHVGVKLWTEDGREWASMEAYSRHIGRSNTHVQKAVKKAVDGVAIIDGVKVYTKDPRRREVRHMKVEKVWTRGMTLLPGLCTHRLG